MDTIGEQKLFKRILEQAWKDLELLNLTNLCRRTNNDTISDGLKAYEWLTSENKGVALIRESYCTNARIPSDALRRRTIELYEPAYQSALDRIKRHQAEG